MPVELYTCCRCGKDKGEKMTAIGRDANSGRTIYVCQLCLSPEEKMYWWTKIDNPRIEEEIWVGPEDPRYISKHMTEEKKEQLPASRHFPGKCAVCGAFITSEDSVRVGNDEIGNFRDENHHVICRKCSDKLTDAVGSHEARQALRMTCKAFAMCTECAIPMYNSPYNNTHEQKVCRQCADKMQGLTAQVSFSPAGGTPIEELTELDKAVRDKEAALNLCAPLGKFLMNRDELTTEEKRDAAALGRTDALPKTDIEEMIDCKVVPDEVEISKPMIAEECDKQDLKGAVLSRRYVEEACAADKQELNQQPFPPVKVDEIDYKARQEEWRAKLANAARTIFQMLSEGRNIIVATDRKTARLVNNIQWKHDKDLVKCRLSIFVDRGIDVDITDTIIREMGTGELIWDGLTFDREDWCGLVPF